MPHRVANFLRSSSGNIAHIKKKATSGSSSRNPSAAASRNNSISASPYASDSDEHHAHAARMPEHLADALRRHHRLSLPFGRSSSKERQERQQPSAVSLDWNVESPPIVLHGTSEESSGALFSGQLFLDVGDGAVDVDSVAASLSLRVTHKRPYQGHCADCQTQRTELKSWRLLAQPSTLARGRHQFPFSMLLEGHLPASMDSPVLSIAYEFKAEAIVVRAGGSSSSSSCLSAKFERPVVVKRSLPDPLYPHHSVRVFPPTNIKASAHYSPIIHPTGNNKLTLKLDGLVTHNEKAKTIDLWKLKKVTWRLEETVKTIAPACARHAPSAAVVTTDEDAAVRKGVFRAETRVIGEKAVQEGWKSDFSGNDGTVDMEFDYTALYPPAKTTGGAAPAKYACDTKTRDGTQVTHTLQLELIVSKEYAPEGKPQQAASTGTGRILRMHFAVTMTEFPGLGVSWDNEAPPVYQDVPPSPPGYPCDEREPPIEYEDLEPLDLEALDAQRATPPRRLSDVELSE
ncbi:Uncharacterized protein C1F12.05 [Tolypocladium ophioglossoides CBS 100239]|uniref:Uncharacterized protein C1F12.05 n=1 Tax=Tolypocladium ophioglossoides (strain CBS 100239) TaxID=1163406 RepID=A0A0L0N4K3_TOLOC|nr:Uncharacterized protein C1F12.05 [Tolypocladium ophioglossoides CBS 100239]